MLPQATVTFIGSGKSFEQEHVAMAGFRYVTIPCQPTPRKPWHALRFIANNLAGYWTARWLLREQHVALVVGLGSYASAGTVRAAQNLQLPTLLLEANAVPGRATRWLAPAASLVCAAYPEVEAHLKPAVRLQITGTPVREAFIATRQPDACRLPLAARLAPRQLTILGGSGGAQRLNEMVPRALYKLGSALESWLVVHQCGAGQVSQTQELYKKLGINAVVVSFIDNLPDVLRATDLVISRAGGGTLAELAVTETPAVLVPYAAAMDDHQTENARRFATAGACRLVPEDDPAARLDDRLVRVLTSLVTNPEERATMSRRMQSLARPRAAADVASLIRELTRSQAHRAAA